jgi:hypothetical protein
MVGKEEGREEGGWEDGRWTPPLKGHVRGVACRRFRHGAHGLRSRTARARKRKQRESSAGSLSLSLSLSLARTSHYTRPHAF